METLESVGFEFYLVPQLGSVRVKFDTETGFFIIINRRSANSASTIKLVKLMKAKKRVSVEQSVS